MKDATPIVIRREDYRPPPYTIESIELELDLDPRETRVSARSVVVRDPREPADAPLVLDGEDMTLESVSIDGSPLAPDAYTLTASSLTLPRVPGRFLLEIVGRVRPKDNRALMGLYVSGGNFCTQCEAEGFRRITWFLDRPDVMARYRTTLRADRTRCPVLLSNGNLVEQGNLADGRHFATWEDPFPKPSYLFALVAGKLARRSDTFVTRSSRKVALEVYVDEDNLDQTEHCVQSLKRAMRWDEEAFGREYDLDVYMIVAVRDFNMGAMENKGLNIFNTKYVLARPDVATDADFQHVEAVVGHEYFHNWSGNRVTCRDWFQLSLKEGFTVFRDQEFSAAMGSPALKRIQDVQRLMAVQFAEDAGPTSHPVRPDSYVEINNFYTATVYEKGAEVVRMIHTLLGAEAFRRGTDLYFERHDGQAVTCDDFVQAMQDASGVDLSQFRLWYAQAGTPVVTARGSFDAAQGTYTLSLSQRVPDTAAQRDKQPMHLPIRVGLLDHDGNDLPLQLSGEAEPQGTTRLLELREPTQSFTFVGLGARPTPSLLRGFSAPVRLECDTTDEDLLLRMAHDSDAYCRWEASQTLAQRRIFAVMEALAQGREPSVDGAFLDAFERALRGDADPQLLTAALTLPAESVLEGHLVEVDPARLHAARLHVERALAQHALPVLERRYAELASPGAYRLDAEAMGRRSLRNLCLRYLMALREAHDGGPALTQLRDATNMTDTLAALACLTHVEGEAHDTAFAEFYTRFEHDALALDKWFATQALSRRKAALDDVARLLRHPCFSIENPNRARALIDSFASGNPVRFHEPTGRGYAFLADRVLEVDAFNPQVAARMIMPLTRFARLEPGRRTRMVSELRRILGAPDLSKDVYEQVSKAIRAASETP
jgi:aminopeptidase N